MGNEQAAFFNAWRRDWHSGIARPVQGQISYLFCYAYDVLRRPPAGAADELRRLSDVYIHTEPFFANYCRTWMSDALVLLGDLQSALDALPALTPSGRSSASADRALSLRAHLKTDFGGRELLALNGPRVTRWGRENLDVVCQFVDAVLEVLRRPTSAELLQEWTDSAHRYSYQVFAGSASCRAVENLHAFTFSSHSAVMEFARRITREAENTAREEVGIPRVGEGWVAETALYRALADAFPSLTIEHHARPSWLGRQHLDIFVHEARFAIEYQGIQHDRPVAYFGGEAGFRATRRRDSRKMRLCRKHGIHLEYARPGYQLDHFVKLIERALARSNVTAGPEGRDGA